jgi:hypothetical protein
MQIWGIDSFLLCLTNDITGSDVIINQDFIDGYEGSGFDMSTSIRMGLVICLLLA